MTNPTPHGQVPEALIYANDLQCESADGHISVNTAKKAATALLRLHAEDELLAALVEAQQPAPSAAAAQEQHYGPLRDADADWGKKLTVYSPTPQADSQPAPIDMVLHCPKCGLQHIDASEPPVEFEPGAAQWNNPPHRSHLCHGCGHIWRPADVPTNGVAAVKTTGKADSPIAASAPADSVTAPAGGVVAGIEAAAKLLERKADDFARENGSDDLGSLSFGRGAHADAKLEYHSTLLELAEEIRSLAPPPPAQAADSVLEDAALSSEQQRAILEAYESAASESYFEVRPQIDCSDRRRVFKAGYERGWDAARKQGGAT